MYVICLTGPDWIRPMQKIDSKSKGPITNYFTSYYDLFVLNKNLLSVRRLEQNSLLTHSKSVELGRFGSVCELINGRTTTPWQLVTGAINNVPTGSR